MPACSLGWTFVSLERGFKFRSCAIELSVRSKTSWDASKHHYLAFPSEKRRCCVEIRNVRYRYFDVSSNLFCSMTGIDYISPTKETFNCVRKFKCVLVCSKYFDHTDGRKGTFVSPFRKRYVVNLHALHPTTSTGNASNKVEYLPWSPFVSLHPHGIAVGCKIAKRGDVNNTRRR